MTYKELLEELLRFSKDQLDMTITYWDKQIDEFYPADIVAIEDSDTIETTDAPHPVIIIKEE